MAFIDGNKGCYNALTVWENGCFVYELQKVGKMWLEKLLFTRFRIRPIEVVFTAYSFMILTAITWALTRDYLGGLDVTSLFAWWDPIEKLIH
jgi:hypothetical protein